MVAELAVEGLDGEGVPAFELERIVFAAAKSKNFKEWGEILADPEISLEAKEYLLYYVHVFSVAPPF
jgi:hypothetical protein